MSLAMAGGAGRAPPPTVALLAARCTPPGEANAKKQPTTSVALLDRGDTALLAAEPYHQKL